MRILAGLLDPGLFVAPSNALNTSNFDAVPTEATRSVPALAPAGLLTPYFMPDGRLITPPPGLPAFLPGGWQDAIPQERLLAFPPSLSLPARWSESPPQDQSYVSYVF